MYKSVIRPILFWLSPTMSRQLLLTGLKIVNSIPILRQIIKYSYSTPSLKRSFFGLDFVGPIGVASGVDSKAEFIDPLCDIGASFVTVGPLTLSGVLSGGQVMEVIDEIRRTPSNPGKVTLADLHIDPLTPDKEKVREIDRLYTLIYDFTDAAIINLQDVPYSLCCEIIDCITGIRRYNDEHKPILIHLNDGYSIQEEAALIHEILSYGLDGVVISACTDTISRLKAIKAATNGLVPVMVSNGAASHNQVKSLLESGADLIAIRDGLFREGPSIIKNVLKQITANEQDSINMHNRG